MKIGIVVPTYDRYAEASVFRGLVQEIERLGFDSAWFGDHIAFPAERPDYLGDSWIDAVSCACAGIGMTHGSNSALTCWSRLIAIRCCWRKWRQPPRCFRAAG